MNPFLYSFVLMSAVQCHVFQPNSPSAFIVTVLLVEILQLITVFLFSIKATRWTLWIREGIL